MIFEKSCFSSSLQRDSEEEEVAEILPKRPKASGAFFDRMQEGKTKEKKKK